MAIFDAIECGNARLALLDTVGGPVLRFEAGTPYPAWTLPIGAPHRLAATRYLPDAIELDLAIFPDAKVHGYGPLTLTLRARIAPDATFPVVHFCDLELVGAPPDFPMEDLAFPGPLTIDGTGSEWRYLLPYGQGILVDTGGTAPHAMRQVALHDYKITMPLVAAFDAGGAAVLMMTPQGHDHAVRPTYGEGPGLRMVQLASLGTWRYDRSWRIATLAGGGINALARIARAELKRSGLQLRSLRDKVAALPAAVQNAPGGTHLWCHMDTLTSKLVGDLAQSGIRSLMVMGRPTDPGVMPAVHDAGFASGPYFQTYDVFPPGSVHELEWRNTYPPEGASHGFPHQLRRNRDGFYDYAWVHLPVARGDHYWAFSDALGSDGKVFRRTHAIHGEYPVQSYRRCQVFHREVIAEHGLPTLDRLRASAVFYDICTTMLGLECADPRHPCDRRDDVELRKAALSMLADSSRVVMSEDGKWWAADLAHGFEGGLNYDGMESFDNITLTDYEFNPYNWQTEFNLHYRVPFFSMVMGYTSAATFWWGRGQDRHAETRRAKDAFAALAGGSPIFVVDPQHPLTPGTSRWEAFVATARAFDALRAEILGVAIESYDVHGPHHATTRFENGVMVRANVGHEPVDGLAAGEYRVHASDGAIVAGNGPVA
jgi:hypothetical protein